MRAEQVALREQLETLQTDNEALAHLLNQQEQLVAGARHQISGSEVRPRTVSR
jgi:hypothetical protein